MDWVNKWTWNDFSVKEDGAPEHTHLLHNQNESMPAQRHLIASAKFYRKFALAGCFKTPLFWPDFVWNYVTCSIFDFTWSILALLLAQVKTSGSVRLWDLPISTLLKGSWTAFVFYFVLFSVVHSKCYPNFHIKKLLDLEFRSNLEVVDSFLSCFNPPH